MRVASRRQPGALVLVVVGLCNADIAPPLKRCSDVCSSSCSGGTQGCCPAGKSACTQQPCGEEEVKLADFSCTDDASGFSFTRSATHCCVPRCSSNEACPDGEVCAHDKASGGRRCRRPTCQDLGGSCRSPAFVAGSRSSSSASSACTEGEVEQTFEQRCDSGCGYWRGRCGQSCCVKTGSSASKAKVGDAAAEYRVPPSMQQLSSSKTTHAEASRGHGAMDMISYMALAGVIAIALALFWQVQPNTAASLHVSISGRQVRQPCE
eukprot:TRINITY_DN76787_c0_g1_i1.p1 TRINITY_DN76787_c0_g1~~TRINITY_DN76787_c0_g1_i1.p1  ORF type:complete len:265 (+),score=46.68 TRINITY_DN76787_c0_g1_i1:79-873(+)